MITKKELIKQLKATTCPGKTNVSFILVDENDNEMHLSNPVIEQIDISGGADNRIMYQFVRIKLNK